ncbi:hypothetical protein NHF50_03300 [Flavobacterium sp. NRK F10]|uniref:Uncharacterized protein n=1 Tax=Flavobacterium sediminis TaxID=2201181 RepID=A0A2U8QS03_9FLAO|nr:MULTISPECIES: hypothetical protein [Flavobacterium]AWM12928.1 hypothetical protein DI487_02960 [Flavobacterium sediminis]MCO6174062.1 hypothetical protein [Flavobacterium sp. NRK F10]
MKLVIITAIAEFEKEIKKILKEAKVLSYSYRDVKGYRDSTEDAVETNWFGAEMNETESVLFYALVSEDNVSLFMNLIHGFNEKQEAKSHIHVAVLNVEQTN